MVRMQDATRQAHDHPRVGVDDETQRQGLGISRAIQDEKNRVVGVARPTTGEVLLALGGASGVALHQPQEESLILANYLVFQHEMTVGRRSDTPNLASTGLHRLSPDCRPASPRIEGAQVRMALDGRAHIRPLRLRTKL